MPPSDVCIALGIEYNLPQNTMAVPAPKQAATNDMLWTFSDAISFEHATVSDLRYTNTTFFPEVRQHHVLSLKKEY